MNKKIFIACLLLLLPFCVLAAERSVSEANLAAYKELSQARSDALKESLQKDMQTQTVRIEAQDKRLEQQDKLLDSFSARISDLSIFLTVFGLVAGLLGYFTVSSRAKKEARIAAAEWIEKEGQKAIDAKLKDLDSHIAAQKQTATAKREELESYIEKLRASAEAPIAELQKQLSASQKSMDGSVQEKTSLTNSDAISQLVEALKHKPEAEYGFDDWNVRAHDAYTKGNLALAAEYWLQAARGGKGSGVQVAQSLYNAGLTLGQLKRNEEAIDVYDEVVSRYGSAPEAALREQVAKALTSKGYALDQLKRSEEALDVYDEVVSRYGSAPEVSLREQAANALLNKSVALDHLNRKEEVLAVSDEVVSHYGSAPEAVLLDRVAKALLNKSVALSQLNRSEEVIAVCDEVMSRYGSAPEASLRVYVTHALNSKGFALLCRAKANWTDEAARLVDLQAAATLFTQAEKETNNKPIVWGNQAYTAFLLGQLDAARPLLKQALQMGGEEFFKVELTDLNIHPVLPDAEFRTLLEEVWAEVKPKSS